MELSTFSRKLFTRTAAKTKKVQRETEEKVRGRTPPWLTFREPVENLLSVCWEGVRRQEAAPVPPRQTTSLKSHDLALSASVERAASWPQKTVAGKRIAILMMTTFPLFKLRPLIPIYQICSPNWLSPLLSFLCVWGGGGRWVDGRVFIQSQSGEAQLSELGERTFLQLHHWKET